MFRKKVYEHWTVIKCLLARVFVHVRTVDSSVDEYELSWSKGLRFLIGYPELYMRFGEPVLIRHLERRKSVVREIDDAMATAHALEVIEFGMGTGVNIVALALLHAADAHPPRFVGIDLTENGRALAMQLAANPPIEIFSVITGLSPAAIEQRKERILNMVSFEKRDMTATGLPSNSFDFLYTYVAIEQLPRVYSKAFAEAYRVLRPSGRAFFMEEFAESQTTMLRRLNVYVRDYFHASVRVLSMVGFVLCRYQPAEYQKYRLGIGSALVEKPVR